ERKRVTHLLVFFIFVVSNLGGLLTPLGDPPLFLGFLNGVPFFWTLRLWREWLLANGIVLVLFFLLGSRALRAEGLRHVPARGARLELDGRFNLLLLAGVIGAVLLQGYIHGVKGDAIGGAVMLALAFVSMRRTPRALRVENGFSWEPVLE